MKRRGFRAEEVLFSPTTACNLACGHCDVPRSGKKLASKDAMRFLLQCKRTGVKRVGFTGGEPFLFLDFLCDVTRRAVEEGFLFDRIMTNAVWWRDENDLKVALIKLYNAGYDGSICVSVDAFHKQDLKKVALFIELACQIWRRPDMVSIAYTAGAKDSQTKTKLRALSALVKKRDRGIFLKFLKIDIAPVGKASTVKSPWDGRWFKEDHCQGPGNILFVMPNGDVKPCCGYANHRKELTIGNIHRDSAKDMIKNLRNNKLICTIYDRGLSCIRKNLENLGVRFPGKTSSHCYFCDYIISKVSKKLFAKSLLALLLAFFAISGCAQAQEIVASKGCHNIPASIVERIKIPRWYHEGLFYDGSSLWLANGEKGKIWVIDPGTGQVTSSIDPVADFTEALIKTDDGTILTTEWFTKKIYRVKLEDSKLIPEKDAIFEPAHPAGLAWNGKRLYVVAWTRGLGGTKFHLIEMDKDFNVLNKMAIRDIQEPDQLTWDGKHLWVSCWYSKSVYKIDVDKWEIIGYFRSPVAKTTGIAWDGKNMWVTGTYGDLYKMQIGE